MVSDRTRTYFIGFLIGCILVGLLLRSRWRIDPPEQVGLQWQPWTVSPQDIPSEWFEVFPGIRLISGARVVDDQGVLHEARLLRRGEGQRPVLFVRSGLASADDGTEGGWEWHEGDRLLVYSQPGIDPELMRAGFDNVGTPLEEPQPEGLPPHAYLVRVQARRFFDLAEAKAMLLSKRLYIDRVEWAPWPSSSERVSDPESADKSGPASQMKP